MSVNGYLTTLADTLVLNSVELEGMKISLSALQGRLQRFFSNEIDEHFQFGSSKRGTILPRKADSRSDIDYMIVFNIDTSAYKPQTYLDKLKRFTECCYSRSEIKQSHPTIKLDLQHITFELVPAIKDYSNYKIPSPASQLTEWMTTNPIEIDIYLTDKNNSSNNIKPLVRLMKYWNARNGYLFSSFELEQYLIELQYYSATSLKDYFYYVWEFIGCNNGSLTTNQKLQSAKQKVAEIKKYDKERDYYYAEEILQKFLPTIWRGI